MHRTISFTIKVATKFLQILYFIIEHETNSQVSCITSIHCSSCIVLALAPKNFLDSKWLTKLVFHGKAMFISIKPNISIMEVMVGMFAQKMGIPPELARMGLSLVSKFFLQNSNPNEASGLLSSLPGLSDMFSDDERRQFTTRQDNVPQEDLLAMLRNQLGVITHSHKDSSRKALDSCKIEQDSRDCLIMPCEI